MTDTIQKGVVLDLNTADWGPNCTYEWRPTYGAEPIDRTDAAKTAQEILVGLAYQLEKEWARNNALVVIAYDRSSPFELAISAIHCKRRYLHSYHLKVFVADWYEAEPKFVLVSERMPLEDERWEGTRRRSIRPTFPLHEPDSVRKTVNAINLYLGKNPAARGMQFRRGHQFAALLKKGELRPRPEPTIKTKLKWTEGAHRLTRKNFPTVAQAIQRWIVWNAGHENIDSIEVTNLGAPTHKGHGNHVTNHWCLEVCLTNKRIYRLYYDNNINKSTVMPAYHISDHAALPLIAKEIRELAALTQRWTQNPNPDHSIPITEHTNVLSRRLLP